MLTTTNYRVAATAFADEHSAEIAVLDCPNIVYSIRHYRGEGWYVRIEGEGWLFDTLAR